MAATLVAFNKLLAAPAIVSFLTLSLEPLFFRGTTMTLHECCNCAFNTLFARAPHIHYRDRQDSFCDLTNNCAFNRRSPSLLYGAPVAHRGLEQQCDCGSRSDRWARSRVMATRSAQRVIEHQASRNAVDSLTALTESCTTRQQGPQTMSALAACLLGTRLLAANSLGRRGSHCRSSCLSCHPATQPCPPKVEATCDCVSKTCSKSTLWGPLRSPATRQ